MDSQQDPGLPIRTSMRWSVSRKESLPTSSRGAFPPRICITLGAYCVSGSVWPQIPILRSSSLEESTALGHFASLGLTMSFDSVPILDLEIARHSTSKLSFLASLRHALLTVGFLYIKNTGIDENLVQDVIEQGTSFFALPQEDKLNIQMKNVPSFLGMCRDLLSFPCSKSPQCYTTSWPQVGSGVQRRFISVHTRRKTIRCFIAAVE